MNQPQKITIGAYTCWLLPDGQFDYPGETILPQEGAPPATTSSETQAKLEAGQLYRLGALERVMKNAVCEKLLPARERLRLVDEPAEPTGGVLVFAAPGHTPGHTAVLVSSNRQQLLYAGDAVIHPKQFEYPDWTSAFDLDANETGITRRNCWTGLWRIAAC